MADSARLLNRTFSGLESLTDQDENELSDAYFGRMYDDISRDADLRTQQTRENAFGRGLGLSTYLNDELGKLETARSDALIRARREADLAARSAQLAALGQAAGAAQTDLSRQQSAVNADADRQQRERGLAQQKSIANSQMLGLGGAMAMSGLGKMFAPEIKQGVAGLAGLLSPNGNGATSPGLDAQRAGERMDFGTASASPASVSDFDMEGAALGSAGTGSFDLGDTGGGGAVGGGGGLDSLFSDFGSSGGAGLFDVGAGGLSDLLSFSDFGSSGGGDLFGLFSDTSWFRPDEWSDVSW